MKLSNSEMDENEKNLRDFYWDLSNPNEVKRISAAQQLVVALLEKQKQSDEICPDLKYAFSRLVGGLASNRKSARPGFAIALTELLSSVPSSVFDANQVFMLMEDKLKLLGSSKNEDKEIMFGRVFCLLALIKSGKLVNEGNTDNLHHVMKEFLHWIKTKIYMKKISFNGIRQIVQQVSPVVFAAIVWPVLSPMFEEGWESCSSDMLQVLILCAQLHPETCSNNFLKTNQWIEDESTETIIIGSHCFKHLSRMIAETTMCHPQIDNFVFDVISTIGKQGPDELGKLWSESLRSTLLFSSPERRYLALKLAVYSLSLITAEEVPDVWSKDLLVVLYYALMNKPNPLHLVCKELHKELGEKLSEEEVTSEVQFALLFQIYSSPGGIHFDTVTRTNVASTIIKHFKLPALMRYIEWLKHLFISGTSSEVWICDTDSDITRTWSASQLPFLVRITNVQRNEMWISSIAQFLFFHSHFKVKCGNKLSDISEVAMVGENELNLTETNRSHVNKCFTTVLTLLSNMPPLPANESEQVNHANKPRVAGVMSTGGFWLSSLINFANRLISSSDVETSFKFDEPIKQAWKKTMENIKKISKIKHSKTDKSSEATAMELLLLHAAFQLLSLDEDAQNPSLDVLEDLLVIIRERFFTRNLRRSKSRKSDDEPHWVEVIVEMLLSMLSTATQSERTTADQVFRLICPCVTEKGLKLITDTLTTNDSELMQVQDVEDVDEEEEDGEEVDEEEEEDEEEVDEEEDGEEVDEEEDEEEVDEEEDGEEVDEEEEDEEDVEEDKTDEIMGSGNDGHDSKIDEEFRQKIKQALGGAAMDEHEDDADDDVEWSDDAMMGIDTMLAEIFKQQKNSRKSGKQKTKQELMHFKLRCLDLIEVFINRQHSSNPLVLNLVLPLLDVALKASADPRQTPLAERAGVMLRIRLCKMKGYPRDISDDVILQCHENIEKLLSRCNHKNGGLFVSQSVSHCCMFYIRVLLGNPGDASFGAVDVDRVTSLYAPLFNDFMQRRDTNVQHCILTDFVSRHPAMAQRFIEILIKYTKDAVHVYRKIQACHMLHSLFSSPESSTKAKSLSQKLSEKLQEILTSVIEKPSEIKPKYISEVLRLLHPPVVSLKKDGAVEWTSLIDLLQKLIELPEVKRSQEMTNLAWKVLTFLGIKRVKGRGKKRKKKDSNENDTTASPENNKDENTESLRQLKSRIRKEKKARKKSKSNRAPEMNNDSKVVSKKKTKKPNKADKDKPSASED